jgi:hypothetical protein
VNCWASSGLLLSKPRLDSKPSPLPNRYVCHSLASVPLATAPPVQAVLRLAALGLDWSCRRCQTLFPYEGIAESDFANTTIGRIQRQPSHDRTRAHENENPPIFYAVRSSYPTRVPSSRQLPTNHNCAVSTRGYQSDPSSPLLLVLSFPLLALTWRTRWNLT